MNRDEFVKEFSCYFLTFFFFVFTFYQTSFAGTVEEEFKIEGLISPASPKALQSVLVKKLNVKIF